MLFVKRLPWYIVAKAVSVFCDVCKQESISWDNRGAGTHMGRSEGDWGVLGGIGGDWGVHWGTWGVTQDMCDHRSGPAHTTSYIFDKTTHLIHVSLHSQLVLLGVAVPSPLTNSTMWIVPLNQCLILFSDLSKQVVVSRWDATALSK